MNNIPVFRNLVFYALCFSIAGGSFLLASLQKDSFSYQFLAVTGMFLFGAAHMLHRFYPEKMQDIRWILGIYTFSAAAMIFRQPLLSDDIFRYIWEGHLQNLGHNPFFRPPNDPVFENEHLNRLVNHPDMPAVYPPFIQLIFRGISAISTGVLFFKIFFTASSIILIAWLFKKRNLFGDGFYLAGVFPFLAIETAWSGHFDVVGILLFAVSLYFLDNGGKRTGRAGAGFFLGLSTMTKVLPAVFFPHYFRESRGLAGKAIFTASFFLPFLLYLFYIDAGWALIYSLKKYATEWVFSGFFYTLLRLSGSDGEILRLLTGSIFIIAYIFIFFKIGNVREGIFLTLLALMIFSPVVHPWYTLWLIPFAGKKYFNACSAFMLASFANYEVLSGWFSAGLWSENPFIVIVGYLGAIAVFLYEFRKGEVNAKK